MNQRNNNSSGYKADMNSCIKNIIEHSYCENSKQDDNYPTKNWTNEKTEEKELYWIMPA